MDFGFETLEPSLSYEELLWTQAGNFENLYYTYLVDMSSFSGSHDQDTDSQGMSEGYQTHDGFGYPCSSSGISSNYSYEEPGDESAFRRIPITDWQGEDCLDWANAVCEKRGLDSACISVSDFRNSTGSVLKQFLPEHFAAIVGDQYGDIFFHELQALRRKNNGKKIPKRVASARAYGVNQPEDRQISVPSGAYQDSDDLFSYTRDDFQDLAQYFPDEEGDSLSHTLQDLELLEEFVPIKYEEQHLSYEHPGQTGHASASPSSSSGATSFSAGDLGSTEDDVFKKIPTNTRRKVRGPRSWEFLVRLMADKRTNPALIKWEDEATATFRLTQPSIIAKMWGKRSKNPNLSYVNFARGLRYHYNTGALEPVSERQLVYRWGPRALEYLNELQKESQ